MRILVADDNPDTVLSLSVLLREWGHEVEGVHSSVDAILAATRSRPDAMILDIGLPVMSGYALANEIRIIFGDHPPALIAVSGKWTGPADQRMAHEVGFDHLLPKPTDPQVLQRILSAVAVRTTSH